MGRKAKGNVKHFLYLKKIRHEIFDFSEETPAELMERLPFEIDVIVKGGDYRPEDVVGFGLRRRVHF